MATIAYLRVSTDKQHLQTQRLEILEWANREGVSIDDWVELEISSRRSSRERGVEALVDRLAPGDTLVVAELSRLGRSLGEVVQTVDRIAARGVRLVTLKENLRVDTGGNGGRDMQSKVLVALFGLLADLERDLISERTKAGLARAKAAGKKLGRPKGTIVGSKLDGRQEEIAGLLRKGVTLASLSRIVDCTPPTLRHFIRTRGLSEALDEGRRTRRGQNPATK
ncbi:MAG: recombinase family protein [Desulfovibrio sp.]|jgi:DNA invertase Pin-like site-specific DNA recombinase